MKSGGKTKSRGAATDNRRQLAAAHDAAKIYFRGLAQAALFLGPRPWFALVEVVIEPLRRVGKVDVVVLCEGVENVLPDALLGAPSSRRS